jgi:ATP-dependent protease ClpP protease subunit
MKPLSNTADHMPFPALRMDGEGDPQTNAPEAVFAPQVRLLGRVDETLLQSFQDQLGQVAKGQEPIAVELMTFGGDAEIGRRIALEVQLARRRLGRRIVFIGKTVVYSAGVTVMAGFSREDRFLSRDAVLLIHCRQLELTIPLSGPLRANALRVQEVLSQIEIGLRIEQDGFSALIDGSDVSLEEVNERAASSWYLPAREALERKLIAGVI